MHPRNHSWIEMSDVRLPRMHATASDPMVFTEYEWLIVRPLVDAAPVRPSGIIKLDEFDVVVLLLH